MTVGKPNFNLNSFGIKYLSKEEVQELLNKAPPMDMRSASERHASNESQRKTGVSNIQNEVNLTSMHGDNTKPAGSGSTGFGKKISGTVKPAKLKPSTNAKIDSQRASNIKELESKKPTATETKDTKFVYNKPRSVSGEGMYRDGKGTHETQSDGKTPSVASPPKGTIGQGNRAVPVSSTGNVKGKERKHVTEAGDDKNEKTEAVAGTMITNPKDGKQRSSARIQWEKRGGQGDPDEKRTPANVKSTGKQRGKLSGYKRDRIVSDAKRSALENIKTDKETAKKWGEAEDKYPASENKDDRTHLDEQYKHVNGHYYHDGKPEKHAETTDKITAKRKKDKIDMEAGKNSRHRKDLENNAAQTAGGVDAEANTKEQTAGESYYGDSDPDKDPLDKRQEGTKEEREEKEEARDDDPDETGYDHKDEDFDDRDESSNESDSGSKTGKHDNSSESGFESEASLNRRIASNEEKRRKGAKEAKSKKKTPEEEKEDKRISGYERAGQKGKKGLKGSSDGSSRPDPARKEDAVNRFDGTPNVYPEAAKRAASKESKKSSDIIMDMNIMKLNLMKDALDGTGKNTTSEIYDGDYNSKKQTKEGQASMERGIYAKERDYSKRLYGSDYHEGRVPREHRDKPYAKPPVTKPYKGKKTDPRIPEKNLTEKERTKIETTGLRNAGLTDRHLPKGDGGEYKRVPDKERPSSGKGSPKDLREKSAEILLKAISLKLDLTSLK